MGLGVNVLEETVHGRVAQLGECGNRDVVRWKHDIITPTGNDSGIKPEGRCNIPQGVSTEAFGEGCNKHPLERIAPCRCPQALNSERGFQELVRS